jgi:hypothetical protein
MAKFSYGSQSFISRSVRLRKRIFSIIFYVAGGFWSFLMVIVTVAAFAGDKDLWEYRYIYFIMLLMGLGILWLGFSKTRDLNRAQLYDQIFMADEDGYIPLSRLASMARRPQEQVMKELTHLIGSGLLQGCTLDREHIPAVRLPAHAGNKTGRAVDFITKRCPYCGASVSMQAGSRAQCAYCDSWIS